jgi:hypothetical protein
MSSDKVLYVNPETKDVIATGNVGIGTTQPLAKLHVNGNVFGVGLVIQCATVNYTEQTSYSAPNTITPTQISALNITITPKKTTSKIVLQWMVNGEGLNNSVYLVYRDSTPIGFNTTIGNVQQSGVTASPYDPDSNTTPYNITITWIDFPNTTSTIVYSIRIRSSTTGSADTFYLNRTMASYVGDFNEGLCSTGIAWEVSL